MSMELLNERSRQIFRQIVDTYLMTGDPVGSRTLSKQLDMPLSPATIRNVMADLEDTGLIYAPHTSAGRIPTDIGLRLFVDGVMEIGNLTDTERQKIRVMCQEKGSRLEDVLPQASNMLSGLSQCASLVFSPKQNRALQHIEFVHLGPGRALVVLVYEGSDVENRIIDIPPGMPPSSLVAAGNYLNARILNKTFDEARDGIEKELAAHQAELDSLTQQLVEQGLAVWSGDGSNDHSDDALIVRGRANLLEDLEAMEDLERIRKLFSDLENKKDLMGLLQSAKDAEGVRIFIGSENNLFSLSGSSVIAAPYMDQQNNILGVIGVIGPTRLNYARIIPMVDYTAKVIGKIL